MQLLSSTLLVATLCLLASPQKVTEVFSGKVIGVSDGDTIEVLINRKPTKVRLEAIDSPESNQSYGNRAKQELSRLVFGKSATIRKTGEDRYERVLGYVMIGDIEVNSKLVEEGWAWYYREYNDEERFANLEVEAREAKRGLWEDPKPLALGSSEPDKNGTKVHPLIIFGSTPLQIYVTTKNVSISANRAEAGSAVRTKEKPVGSAVAEPKCCYREYP